MTPGPQPPRSADGGRTGGRHRLIAEYVSGAGCVDDLAPAWRALAGPESLYAVRHAWYRNYVATLENNGGDLHFFILKEGRRVLAIVPLRAGVRRVRGLTLRTLELPWHPEMAITDIVAGARDLDKPAARSLAEATRRAGLAWDALVFRGVTNTSAAFRWTDNWPRAVRIPMGHRDYLVMDRPYEQMLASFSKNFRGNLRKARNKLRGTDGVEFLRAPEDLDLEQALATFLEVEASGWKGAGGTAIRADVDRTRFYSGVVRDIGSDGGLEINLLTLEGRPLAGQLCIRSGAVLHVLKIGYDEAYAALAPGNMLLEHLLEECPSRGITEVDLVTDAPWHADWRPASQPVLEILLLNRTVPGALAWLAYRARESLGGGDR